MSWRAVLAFFVPFVALVVSVISLIQSHQSIELAKEAMQKNERPWFIVDNMEVQHPDEDSFRVIGFLKHYSGGPALNVRFAIGIKGEFSELHDDTPALLPGSELNIAAPLVTGPKLKVGDEVEWRFTYNDVSERCYESHQVLMFRSAGGIKFVKIENKEVDCEP